MEQNIQQNEQARNQHNTRMVRITPEVAEGLLRTNTHNRPLSKPYVRELRKELEEGRWVSTHQGIGVASDGTLLDGQHRLTAIVESGVAVDMLITDGLPRDSFGAIDQHRRRTGGQILALAGISKDAPRMVAMARAILQVVHGVNKVSNTAAAEYAVAHQTELELFLPVARQYTPAVGAAFAWCATLGWGETINAADRLLSTLWADPAELDPMRALHSRARNFSELGAGQAGIKARFDIALGCLEAVHEERGLQKARSYRPDYGKLERESLRPRAEGRPSEPQKSIHPARQGKLPVIFDPEQMASHVIEFTKTQERIELERSAFTPESIPATSLAYTSDADRDAGVDDAVEAELVKAKKARKSAG